jgi:small subunit ribosomal protein S21
LGVVESGGVSYSSHDFDPRSEGASCHFAFAAFGRTQDLNQRLIDMSEVHLKKGEPVDKALRRLKKKLDREQTLIQVRLHRRFEKPSAKRRRKEKAARFTAMLKARYADV